MAPIVCSLDGIVLILAAIGIPTITNSGSQTVEDGVLWKLSAVLM